MSEHPAHSGHEYGGAYARAAALAGGDPDWQNATGGEGGRLIFHEGQRLRVMGILPDDPAPLEIGDEGTVVLVDDGGTAHVDWDSGRTLGVLPTDPVAVVITLKLTPEEQALFETHAIHAYSIDSVALPELPPANGVQTSVPESED